MKEVRKVFAADVFPEKCLRFLTNYKRKHEARRNILSFKQWKRVISTEKKLMLGLNFYYRNTSSILIIGKHSH